MNTTIGEPNAIAISFFLGFMTKFVAALFLPVVLAAAGAMVPDVWRRLMEEKLRQALALSEGSFMTFIERPVSAVLLLLALVVIVIAVLPAVRKGREEAFQE